MLAEREALFRQQGFDSVGALRNARASGSVDDGFSGDVVLVIDGWSGLRESDPAFDGFLDEILGPGSGSRGAHRAHQHVRTSAADQNGGRLRRSDRAAAQRLL